MRFVFVQGSSKAGDWQLDTVRLIFANSGAKEGDGHILPLANNKVPDYLVSFWYLKNNPTDLKYLVQTGMILRKRKRAVHPGSGRQRNGPPRSTGGS